MVQQRQGKPWQLIWLNHTDVALVPLACECQLVESCLLSLFLIWCESTICLCPFIENGERVSSFFVSGLNFSLGKSQPDNNNA